MIFTTYFDVYCIEKYTIHDEEYLNIFQKNFFFCKYFNEIEILVIIILKMYNFGAKTSTKQL